MKNHARRALLVLLGLSATAACSDLPTAAPTSTGADVAPAPAFATAPASASLSGAVDAIVNGSFETGDFTGWTAAPTGESHAWAVGGAGLGGAAGMGVTAPADSTHVAWNDFNAAGPAGFTLYQDVALPGDSVAIAWRYRAQWTSDYSDNQPRTAEWQLLDPVTGDTLATLHSFTTGPAAESPTGDTGWRSITVPFAGASGRVVRLQVTQSIPDFFPGPGQFEVDAFSMMALGASPGGDNPPSEPPSDPAEEELPGLDPTSKSDCLKGGWAAFGFKNQGQCVRFVETGKDSR